MNLKKAKAMRRVARQLTVGYPEVAYQRLKPTRVFASTVIGAPSAIHLGHVVLDPNCTRAVYLRMKKTAGLKLPSRPKTLRKAA